MMDSEEDDLVPTVSVNGRTIAITDINDTVISEMTPQEKEAYIQISQDFYAANYD